MNEFYNNNQYLNLNKIQSKIILHFISIEEKLIHVFPVYKLFNLYLTILLNMNTNYKIFLK